MALGRRPTAKVALAFLCNPHTTRIHTKIIIVDTNFGGAVFRSTTPSLEEGLEVRKRPCAWRVRDVAGHICVG